MYNTDYDLFVYFKEDLTCKVKVRGTLVTFENYISDPIWLPFGINTEANLDMLEEFYEDRCFPRERANCNQILRALGVDCYEPELICRKTHGLQFDDFMWLQFSDEPQVSWEEIRLR